MFNVIDIYSFISVSGCVGMQGRIQGGGGGGWGGGGGGGGRPPKIGKKYDFLA